MIAGSRRRRNLQHRLNREQLLAGASSRREEDERRSKTNSKHNDHDSSAIDQAKEVTSSLMRTKNMIRQELSRVHDVSHVIDKDGEALNDTNIAHKGFDSIVKGARKSLNLLKRNDIQEAVVLWCAVIFFYLCALYVVWTRMRIPFLLW